MKAPPLQREHRLYQADWLMRFYGFASEEITQGSADQMLDLEIDPKLAWALRNRNKFPININTADREMLLRVPGLGQRAVDKLIIARRHRTLRLDDLSRLSAAIRRARPFIIASDYCPPRDHESSQLRAMLAARTQQLSLFG